MERSEGTGKTAVVLVFVPLVCLRLQTDIWRLNLVFSPCRVVQNVLIFYKTVIWPLPCTERPVWFCWWEVHQNGCFKFAPTETEPNSFRQWIMEREAFLTESESL